MSERLKKTPVWHKVFGVIETLALAACATGERISFVTPTPEGTSTNPTETVSPPETPFIADIDTFLPIEGSFKSPVLSGEIVSVQNLSISEADSLVPNVDGVCARMVAQYSIPASLGPNCITFGYKLEDSQSHEQPILFGLIVNSAGEAITPTPDASGKVLLPVSGFGIFTASDGLSFVPLGEGLPQAGNRLLPMGVNYEGDKTYLSLGIEDYGPTLPVLEIDQNGKIFYHDPYSGLMTELAQDQLPAGVGRYLASLKPIETPTETPTPEKVFVPEGFQIGELGLLRNPETGRNVLAMNPEADWDRVREEIIDGLWQANVDWFSFTGESSDALNYSKENFIKAALEGKTFTIGIPVRANNIDWDNIDKEKYHAAYGTRPSMLGLKMVEARLDDIQIQILDPDAFKNYLEGKDWWDEDVEAFAPYAQYRSESPISATYFSIDDGGGLIISIGSYYFRNTRPVPIEFWLGRFNSEQGIGSEADQAITLFLGKTTGSLENFSAGEMKITGLDGAIIKSVSLSIISQDVVWEKWYVSPQLFIFNK